MLLCSLFLSNKLTLLHMEDNLDDGENMLMDVRL